MNKLFENWRNFVNEKNNKFPDDEVIPGVTYDPSDTPEEQDQSLPPEEEEEELQYTPGVYDPEEAPPRQKNPDPRYKKGIPERPSHNWETHGVFVSDNYNADIEKKYYYRNGDYFDKDGNEITAENMPEDFLNLTFELPEKPDVTKQSLDDPNLHKVVKSMSQSETSLKKDLHQLARLKFVGDEEKLPAGYPSKFPDDSGEWLTPVDIMNRSWIAKQLPKGAQIIVDYYNAHPENFEYVVDSAVFATKTDEEDGKVLYTAQYDKIVNNLEALLKETLEAAEKYYTNPRIINKIVNKLDGAFSQEVVEAYIKVLISKIAFYSLLDKSGRVEIPKRVWKYYQDNPTEDSYVVFPKKGSGNPPKENIVVFINPLIDLGQIKNSLKVTIPYIINRYLREDATHGSKFDYGYNKSPLQYKILMMVKMYMIENEYFDEKTSEITPEGQEWVKTLKNNPEAELKKVGIKNPTWVDLMVDFINKSELEDITNNLQKISERKNERNTNRMAKVRRPK